MEQTEAVTRDKLIADLKAVISDADALIRATAGQAGEKISVARAKAEQGLKVARERLGELEGQVVARGREAAQTADKFVRDQPWTAVGIGAGIGLLIGLLIGRR
jgi:ElaB/YqjD/DUF883 family membrane-anchored ribosome-binding protein